MMIVVVQLREGFIRQFSLPFESLEQVVAFGQTVKLMLINKKILTNV